MPCQLNTARYVKHLKWRIYVNSLIQGVAPNTKGTETSLGSRTTWQQKDPLLRPFQPRLEILSVASAFYFLPHLLFQYYASRKAAPFTSSAISQYQLSNIIMPPKKATGASKNAAHTSYRGMLSQILSHRACVYAIMASPLSRNFY